MVGFLQTHTHKRSTKTWIVQVLFSEQYFKGSAKATIVTQCKVHSEQGNMGQSSNPVTRSPEMHGTDHSEPDHIIVQKADESPHPSQYLTVMIGYQESDEE